MTLGSALDWMGYLWVMGLAALAVVGVGLWAWDRRPWRAKPIPFGERLERRVWRTWARQEEGKLKEMQEQREPLWTPDSEKVAEVLREANQRDAPR